jgi:hypothetical protein
MEYWNEVRISVYAFYFACALLMFYALCGIVDTIMREYE